jgi:hypothetical protein
MFSDTTASGGLAIDDVRKAREFSSARPGRTEPYVSCRRVNFEFGFLLDRVQRDAEDELLAAVERYDDISHRLGEAANPGTPAAPG